MAVFAATASGTPAMELPEKGLLSRPLANPASSRSARAWETSAGDEADVIPEEDANAEENEEAKAGSGTGALKAAVSAAIWAAGRPPTAAVLMRTARSGRAVRGSIGRCIVSKFQRVCLLACGLPLYLRDVFGNAFQGCASHGWMRASPSRTAKKALRPLPHGGLGWVGVGFEPDLCWTRRVNKALACYRLYETLKQLRWCLESPKKNRPRLPPTAPPSLRSPRLSGTGT